MITTVFSAQLYSRSHKTKRLLNELNANGDNVTESDIITKSADVSEAVRDLLAIIGDTSWLAMSLYAKLLPARDASGS
jgi:hypothetical protein